MKVAATQKVCVKVAKTVCKRIVHELADLQDERTHLKMIVHGLHTAAVAAQKIKDDRGLHEQLVHMYGEQLDVIDKLDCEIQDLLSEVDL